MTRQKKNQFRALVLLTVFLLNTVAGFACSLGVKMGYNEDHHQEAPADTTGGHSHSVSHSHDTAHHGTIASENIFEHKSLTAGNDDCCAMGVTGFIKLDKSIVTNQLLQSQVFLITLVSQFFLTETEEPLSTITACSLRRSWHLPNDTDLRIVIQSFQI